MTDITSVKRKCTICTKVFNSTQRTGRPPAFCSPLCREKSKKTKERYCITCEECFIVKDNLFGPFYDTEECQKYSPCQHCGKPCKLRFCSPECINAVYPPPYTCQVCGQPFWASEYFVGKQASLNGPPIYCNREHFEMRGMPITLGKKPVNARRMVAFDIAMSRITSTTPYSLPLQAGGAPWVGMKPTIPQSSLHIKSRNTIRFWDWASNEFLEGLTPLEYNAFLFEFVCRRRSNHRDEVEIQECWTLWPYIEQFLDERYSPTMFEKFSNDYLYARKAYFRQQGCRDKEDLDQLVRQCVSAFQLEVGEPSKSKSMMHKNFIEKWIRPLTTLKAPWANKERPLGPRHFSRIQVEIGRHYKAIEKVDNDEMRLAYLSPLTKEQYEALVALYAKIMEAASKAYYIDWKLPHLDSRGKLKTSMIKPRQTPYPWGYNCYSAMVAAHKEDSIEAIKFEMRTTPNYNLPELSPYERNRF